jgi:perosamine synthetase
MSLPVRPTAPCGGLVHSGQQREQNPGAGRSRGKHAPGRRASQSAASGADPGNNICHRRWYLPPDGDSSLTTPKVARRIGIGTADITPEDRLRVDAVLQSGRLSAGPMTAEFESRFANLHDRRFASMCNSGTGALQLALQALKERRGWPTGAEVIVPAMTFVATINVVLFNGLQPVLVDIDPVTFTIDPVRFEEAITPRTVAVIPVHLFGQPAEMTRVMEIATRHGLSVVEDSAEAVAVRHRGRPVGSFGDFGCFSTYMAHLVTTGVGGLAITDDEENAVRFRSLMNHGRNPRYIRIDDDQGLTDEELVRVVWSRYDFHSLGQSYRATEMEAALGIGQLDRLSTILEQRRAVARQLTTALSDERLQLPVVAHGNEHAFMMYPIVCRDEGTRDQLVVALERAGVETRFLLPVLGQACYQGRLEFPVGSFPATERATSQGFYVGSHQGMSADDVDYISNVVRAALDAS